jgi:hypothetical protein
MLTVDEDVVKVELPQNVDHPWRGEGKAVATRLEEWRIRLASLRHAPSIFDAVVVGLWVTRSAIHQIHSLYGQLKRCL